MGRNRRGIPVLFQFPPTKPLNKISDEDHHAPPSAVVLPMGSWQTSKKAGLERDRMAHPGMAPDPEPLEKK